MKLKHYIGCFVIFIIMACLFKDECCNEHVLSTSSNDYIIDFRIDDDFKRNNEWDIVFKECIKRNMHNISKNINYNEMKENITVKYKNEAPKEWGEKVNGVITSFITEEKAIALTFDACGGGSGNGYDKELIDYLISERVKATLFINSRWIDNNKETFISLANNELFEIENHGAMHMPLSVNGRNIYGIAGTKNIEEAFDEVVNNEIKINSIINRKCKYFRAGTAYYDDVAVKIVNEIGERAVNFNIIGDAGATFNREQIVNACKKPKPGSIIIFHMNHPEKDTAEGIMLLIPLLKKEGYTFLKLEETNI